MEEDAGEGAGLGLQDLLSPSRKQGKAWARTNVGAAGMAGASVTTGYSWRIDGCSAGTGHI